MTNGNNIQKWIAKAPALLSLEKASELLMHCDTWLPSANSPNQKKKKKKCFIVLFWDVRGQLGNRRVES